MGRARQMVVMILVVVLGLSAGAAAALDSRAAMPPRRYLRWNLDDTRAIRGDKTHTARSTVHLLFPADWDRLTRSTARYTFRMSGSSTGCSLTLTAFDVVRTGPAVAPAAMLRKELPAASPRHVLDEGQRNGAAWRVVRRKGAPVVGRKGAPIVGRYVTRSARLEKALGGTAPAVWHEIDLFITSHGECHSGRYRVAGRQIGDVLASL